MILKLLKKSIGMSLVEIMITLGITSIIVTMIFEITTRGTKATTEMQARVQLAQWRSDIVTTLGDPQNVTGTFVNTTLTAAGVAGNQVTISRVNGGVLLPVLTQMPAGSFFSGARVDSIVIDDTSITADAVVANRRNFNLQVVFEIRTRRGNVLLNNPPMTIPISVRVDGADIVQSGFAAGSVTDALQQSCISQGGTLNDSFECVSADGTTLAEVISGNTSFIELANERIRDLQSKVCEIENNIGAGNPQCTFLDCGSSRTLADCTAAGGTFDDSLGVKLCRFANACAVGWAPCINSSGQGYTTTSAITCNTGVCDPDSPSITHAGHAWGNLSQEKEPYHSAANCTTVTPSFDAADPYGSCSPCSVLADKTGCMSCTIVSGAEDATCNATVTQIGCI